MYKNNFGRRICKFEALEDRRLLTVYNVTTVADLVDPLDGKLSLREAIDLANAHPGPDVVVLKAGPNAYKITIAGGGEDNNQTGDFDIKDDLTIKSAGSGFPTIGGNGLDRVFNIPVGFDGVDLTLNHVIVTGGISRTPGSGNGGGVAGESDGNTLSVINNASVKNNISTSPGGGLGGGIYNLSGDINITNSHVDNNSAAAGVTGRGGGIYLESGPGVITIKNSTVNSNSAYERGGGIFSDSTLSFSLIGSQLNNNHCGDSGGGGAQLSSQTIAITGSTVSGNTSAAGGGGISAIFQQDITITRSTFAGNSAVGNGGGLDAPGSHVIVTGSTFKDNTSSSEGGAMTCNDLEVTDSTFNHNVAQSFGGAIFQGLSADIIILRSTFTKNASLGDEAGAIFANGSSGTMTVTLSKFTFNSALDNGGGIFAGGEEVIVDRSTFDHNTSVNGSGGAIYFATLSATDSTFTYNTAKADGGAINSFGRGMSYIRCVFRCNTAANGEGGGFSDGNNSVLTDITVQDCTFDGNTAGGNGGGFTVTGEQLTMTGTTLSNNRSGSDGGGAYIITSGLDVDMEGSSIINCTFSGNGAATDGGGLTFEGDGDLTIYFVTIAFNSSFNGGGIAQTSGAGTIHIGNSIVAKNNATNDPDAYNATAQPFDDLGHNLVFSDPDSVFSDPNSDDIFGLAPLLGALANNGGPTKTHALLKNSPALNAADNSLLSQPITVDQRGFKRPVGPVPAPDIGAYEKQ